MKGLLTIGLLIFSNMFMTIAWYGQLQLNVFKDKSILMIILMSWLIALPEYCLLIPANRTGFVDNGGPFSLIQLKVIQEVISLIVFATITIVVFKTEQFRVNHIFSAIFLVLAVYFAYKK